MGSNPNSGREKGNCWDKVCSRANQGQAWTSVSECVHWLSECVCVPRCFLCLSAHQDHPSNITCNLAHVKGPFGPGFECGLSLGTGVGVNKVSICCVALTHSSVLTQASMSTNQVSHLAENDERSGSHSCGTQFWQSRTHCSTKWKGHTRQYLKAWRHLCVKFVLSLV